MIRLGEIELPENFRYRKAFLRGRPQHKPYDGFWGRHPNMDTDHRAKIFAPFAALKGFEEEIAAKQVVYCRRIDQSEGEMEDLGRKLAALQRCAYNGRIAIQNHVIVTVTYFQEHNADRRPAAVCFGRDASEGKTSSRDGRYTTVTGMIPKVDSIAMIVVVNHHAIRFADVLDVTTEQAGILPEMEWVG